MSPEAKVDKLLQNLEQLFVGGQNSDIILKVENREFPVHKGILTVRSPVFACMFKHDTSENVTGIVNIPDCSAESFEVFLLYLYTGNINTISPENVFNVYYIADKYCIDDLKDHIIKFLKENMSIDTCCDIFSLALRHSDIELQNLSSEFFCKNLVSIVNTDDWKKFSRENREVVDELFKRTLQCLKIK